MKIIILCPKAVVQLAEKRSEDEAFSVTIPLLEKHLVNNHTPFSQILDLVITFLVNGKKIVKCQIIKFTNMSNVDVTQKGPKKNFLFLCVN